MRYVLLYTLKRIQNRRRLADDILNFNCVCENCCILIEIYLKFVPKCSITNNIALLQITVWHKTGDRPLYEANMAMFTDAYMHYLAPLSYIQQKFVSCLLRLYSSIILLNLNTVGCRYNAVSYNTILHMLLQWLTLNNYQRSNSKTLSLSLKYKHGCLTLSWE